MKRWGTILCLCLLPMLLFSACAEATAQVDFVANKDVKKIFDDVHIEKIFHVWVRRSY